MAGGKNWIKGAIKKPGAFTAQRDRYNRTHKGKNLTTNQFAKKVLSPGSKFSPKTIIASFIWPERAAQIPAAEMIYLSLAGVIMAFFGADAAVSRKKVK